nr:putative mitochondrial protein [Ipomoea batatas]
MHSSLNFLVSGQAQHIFFFGLESGPTDVPGLLSSGGFGKAIAHDELSIGSPPMVKISWLQSDPAKLEAVAAWPKPLSVKALRVFLGLARYYRRFIKGYGVISKPLTDMLKKDAFRWRLEAEVASDELNGGCSSSGGHLPITCLSLTRFLETVHCRS